MTPPAPTITVTSSASRVVYGQSCQFTLTVSGGGTPAPTITNVAGFSNGNFTSLGGDGATWTVSSIATPLGSGFADHTERCTLDVHLSNGSTIQKSLSLTVTSAVASLTDIDFGTQIYDSVAVLSRRHAFTRTTEGSGVSVKARVAAPANGFTVTPPETSTNVTVSASPSSAGTHTARVELYTTVAGTEYSQRSMSVTINAVSLSTGTPAAEASGSSGSSAAAGAAAPPAPKNTRLEFAVPSPETSLTMGYRSDKGLDGFSAQTRAGIWISAEGKKDETLGQLTAKSNGQVLFQSLDEDLFLLAKNDLVNVSQASLLLAGGGGVKFYGGMGTSEIEEISPNETSKPQKAMKEIAEQSEFWSQVWEGVDTAFALGNMAYELFQMRTKRNFKAFSKSMWASAALTTASAAAVSAVNIASIHGKVPVMNIHAKSGLNLGTLSFTSIYGTAGYVSFGTFGQLWGLATAGILSPGVVELSARKAVTLTAIRGDVGVTSLGKIEMQSKKTISMRSKKIMLGRKIAETSVPKQLPTVKTVLDAEDTVSLKSEAISVQSMTTEVEAAKRVVVQTDETIEIKVGSSTVKITPSGIKATGPGGNVLELNKDGVSLLAATGSKTTLREKLIVMASGPSKVTLSDSAVNVTGMVTFGP